MNSVTQFAQYLLKLDPQKSSARSALYNYLKHIIDPQETFTPQVIEGFYARALNFEYWQNNSRMLAETVKQDLKGFLKQMAINEEPFANIRHPDSLQIINLKNFSDFEEIVRHQERTRRKSGDEVKFLKVSEAEILALLLSNIGTLEVKVFGPRAVVSGRQLIPLAPMTHLHYSSQMELMPHVRQILEGSLLTTISFYQDEQGLNGLITRGHSFQKFETFLRAHPSHNYDFFCSLKKIERHFIDPQSDPHYQELIHVLERANRVLSQNHGPEARKSAEKILQKGEIALRAIFPNDRLLQLLVTHLQYGLSQPLTADRNHVARSVE